MVSNSDQLFSPAWAIYGKNVKFRNILSGRVSTPQSAEAFMKAVSDAGHQARIAEVKDDKN